MNSRTSPPTRGYRLGKRADAAAATAERILDAAIETFWSGSYELPLQEVADRAGVTVQTVIRRFGNKELLLKAAADREAERIAAQRDEAPTGDVEAAMRVLVEHYERYGEGVLRMLAAEQRFDALAEITERGRAYHADWCARVFAAALAERTGSERKRLHAQLIALTDVYVWKLLRIDRRLSRKQTEIAVVEIVQRLIGEA